MGSLLVLLLLVPLIVVFALGIGRSVQRQLAHRPVPVGQLPASLAERLGGELGDDGAARVTVEGRRLEIELRPSREDPEQVVATVREPGVLPERSGSITVRPPLMPAVGDLRAVLRVQATDEALRAALLDDEASLRALGALLPDGQEASVSVSDGDLEAVLAPVPPYPDVVLAEAAQVAALADALSSSRMATERS